MPDFATYQPQQHASARGMDNGKHDELQSYDRALLHISFISLCARGLGNGKEHERPESVPCLALAAVAGFVASALLVFYGQSLLAALVLADAAFGLWWWWRVDSRCLFFACVYVMAAGGMALGHAPGLVAPEAAGALRAAGLCGALLGAWGLANVWLLYACAPAVADDAESGRLLVQ